MGNALRGVWMMAGVLYTIVEAVGKTLTAISRESISIVIDEQSGEQERVRQRLLSNIIDDGRQPQLAPLRIRTGALDRRR